MTYANNDYGEQKRSHFNKSSANAAAQSLPNIEKLESHRGGKQSTKGSAANYN